MVAQLFEGAQAAVVTHNGFGCGEAADAGDGHAVAAITLQEIEVGGLAAEMGGEIKGDVAIAAPREIDAGVFQLGKYFQHITAHGLGHALGIVDEFTVFTAEQQSSVGAEAVVIEHVAVVAHGHVVAD